MIRGVAAAATIPPAAEAATAALEAGGSAADAVIAGFFAAAGAQPGALLAPAIALVAGAAAGTRAFDGRAAQPGAGAPRPRGFIDEGSIPDGARVAVPRSVAMLMLLHTYRGRATLSSLAKHGVLAAERAGSKARAGLIRRVGQAGVLALRSPEVLRALLAVGGPVAGGILTAEDLEEARPGEGDAVVTAVGEGTSVFTAPWAAGEAPGGDAEAIVACDGRGIVAALGYVPARRGVVVPELEIEVRRDAVPVRRGVTRVAPGTVLEAAAPIAIVARSGFAAAVGLPGRARVEATRIGEIAGGAAVEAVLGGICEQGGRGAIAVVSDGRDARGVVVG